MKARMFLVLVLCILSVSYSRAESNLIVGMGSYTNNGSFGSSWSIDVFSDGKVESEETESMLASDEINVINSNITNFKSAEFCREVEELGFFSLPRYISPEFVSIDGPQFFLEFQCSEKVKRVSLIPEFEGADLKPEILSNIDIFKKTWALLWQYTIVVPPNIEHQL